MRLTENVLDTTNKFAVVSKGTKDRAISNARGYRRMANKAQTPKERERYLSLMCKSVKVARAASRMLRSMKRFEHSVTK